MSVTISREEDLKNLAYIYAQIYGSDIRLSPVANKPYLGLDVRSGDYDITGIVEGNEFKEAIVITTQRYLVELYTPLSVDGLQGSNFIKYTKELQGIDLDTKVKILKAELLLVGLKIPQIKAITQITAVALDSHTLKFGVNFELITGEISLFYIMENV